MLDSTFLEVVIGLIFVYLLLSLLGSAINEIVMTALNMRGYLLLKAVEAMLQPDPPTSAEAGRWSGLKRRFITARLFFARSREKKLTGTAKAFVSNPIYYRLKNPGSTRTPSYMNSRRFSEILLFTLSNASQDESSEEPKPVTLENVVKGLQAGNSNTLLNHLVEESGGSLGKLRADLETWYDTVMEQATGWYKRRVQIFLFFIGIGIAAVLNADTFDIARTLNEDPDARRQMVQMALEYDNRQNPPAVDTMDGTTAVTLDDLLASFDRVNLLVHEDITPAVQVLGMGWRDTERYRVTDSTIRRIAREFTQEMADSLRDLKRLWPLRRGAFLQAARQRLGPAFVARHQEALLQHAVYEPRLLDWLWHGVGWTLTAFAISLGAPFWFDLLNKVANLRGAQNRPGSSARSREADAVG